MNVNNYMRGNAHTVIQAGTIHGDVNLYAQQGAMPLAIAALDHTSVLTSTAEDFTGREWLLERLAAVDVARTGQYVLVAAAAGMGKTTLAARLVREWDCAHHFTQGVTHSGEAAVALRSLAAQLVRAYDLTEFAPGGLLVPWAGDPTYFPKVLAAAAGHGPVRLVVDGLDEAAGDDGLALGLPHPQQLPAGVLVVATYRDGLDPARLPEGERVLRLRIDASAGENQRDVHRYLTVQAGQPAVAARLAAAGIPASEFVATLAERSGGVWIYLRYVLARLRQQDWTHADLDTLPAGLTAYYRAQVTGRRAYPDFYIQDLPLLATLAAAGQPMSLLQLTRITGLDPGVVTTLCEGRYRPFLTADGARHAILHASLRDFLCGEHQDAVLTAHHRIADDCLSGDPAREDQYALRHLPSHLVAAGRHDELRTLFVSPADTSGSLCDTAWADHHDRAGTLETYLSGLALAQRETQRRTDEAVAKGLPAPSLGAESEYALLAANLASASGSLPPVLLAELVKAGLWEHSRALSHARRCHDPKQRAAALTALVPSPDPAVVPDILTAVDAMPEPADQAIALAEVLPHLDADQLERAAQAVVALLLPAKLPGGPEKGQVLVEVVTRLTGAARRRVFALLRAHLASGHQMDLLDRVLEPEEQDCLLDDLASHPEYDEAARAWGLAELAPRLDDSQLCQAFRAAETLTDGYYRAQALAGLCRHLGRPYPLPALHDTQHRAIALTGQAVHLSPAEREEVLTTLITPQTGLSRGVLMAMPALRPLTWLAEYLDTAARDRLVEAVVAGQLRVSDVIEELPRLAPWLNPDQFGRVLAAMPDGTAATLLARLPATHRDLARRALTAELVTAQPEQLADLLTADWIPTLIDTRRPDLLAYLARLVSGPRRADLLTRALRAARPVNHDIQAHTAACLAALLDDTAVAAALPAVTAIADPLRRARALIPLSARLSTPEAVHDCASALLATNHPAVAELAGLGPQLSEDLSCQAVRAPADLTWNVEKVAERVMALSPWLTGSALDQALHSVEALGEHPQALWAAAALATSLPEPQRTATLTAALQRARRLPHTSLRPVAIFVLLNRLSPHDAAAFLPNALQEANAVPEALPRLRARIVLALHLPEEPRDRLLADIVDEVTRFTDYSYWGQEERLLPRIRTEEGIENDVFQSSPEMVRVELLRALVPHLRGQIREDTLDLAWTVALQASAKAAKPGGAHNYMLQDRYHAAVPELAPHLAPRHLPEALTTALNLRHIDSGRACRAVFARISALADTLPATDIVTALRQLHQILPPRDLLLAATAAAAPAVAHVAGIEAVSHQFYAVLGTR